MLAVTHISCPPAKNRAGDRRQYLAGDAVGLVHIGNVWQHEDELITALANDGVGVTGTFL
jgi:hypothetical protein